MSYPRSLYGKEILTSCRQNKNSPSAQPAQTVSCIVYFWLTGDSDCSLVYKTCKSYNHQHQLSDQSSCHDSWHEPGNKHIDGQQTPEIIWSINKVDERSKLCCNSQFHWWISPATSTSMNDTCLHHRQCQWINQPSELLDLQKTLSITTCATIWKGPTLRASGSALNKLPGQTPRKSSQLSAKILTNNYE